MSSTSSPDDHAALSFVERAQNFVSDHKKAVLVSAALIAAIGGGLYYVASTPGSSNGSAGGRSSPSELDSESGKRKKKSKSSKKKKKETKDNDGPILEEIIKDEQNLSNDPLLSTDASTLTTEERTALANSLKTKGNKAYTDRRFQEAVALYTRAIEITPKPDPVYYSNRAACYMYFSTPEYQKAIDDCTEALKINPAHTRSLGRRGNALEKLENYQEALCDFTAVTLLSSFSDATASKAVERVLKKLAETKAAEIFSKREPRLPPHSFVDAYFGAFRSRPRPKFPDEPTQGDSTLALALDALDAKSYSHAVTLTNESIEQGISFSEGKAIALNLRGSFRFLWGDSQGASEDLLEAIMVMPSYTQSWVKIASVYMEKSEAVKAFEAFEHAIEHDSKDPDIYYHRGQVFFIMQQFEQAAEDYRKSVELDPSFVFSHIQLAVAQYKNGNLANAMATFRKALKQFPERSEPNNYYGELLLDQKRLEDAIEKFDRAIEIERNGKPPINVIAMVNKGLAVFQLKNDLEGAEKIIKEALEHDPDCEAAVATLAQLSLQQGKIEQASRLFERQVELARTEPDIANALQFLYAAEAQREFMKNYPKAAAQFMQVSPDLLATAGSSSS